MSPAEKLEASACAELALRHGISATPSRNERGERTLVLTRGVWCKEVKLADLRTALAELRAVREEVPA